MHSLPCPLLLLLPLYALPIFLSLPTSALPSCSPSDLFSLQAFQSSISTSLPWTNHTNCCSWLGVVCNSQGRIVSLHLPSSNLSGSISPHLFHLSALHSLNLSHNSLHGMVAPNIANMSALSILDLSQNPHLIGHIPGQLPPKLRYLDLTHCSFDGSIIINGSTLEEVFIGDNFFSSVASSSKVSMKALQTFDAPRNFFTTSVLRTLQFCANLRIVNLDRNYLGGLIPSEIGMLSKLEVVRLQGNRIAGIVPQELGFCTQMREIWLDDNNLKGTIPKELGKLSLLTILSLSNNRLEGSIPNAIVGCVHLSFLSLSGNAISGEIPAALGGLPNLEVFLTANNSFLGAMPRQLGRLGRLRVLDVARNRGISGSVLANDVAGNRGISGGVLVQDVAGNRGISGGVSADYQSSCCRRGIFCSTSEWLCAIGAGEISNKLAIKCWLWQYMFNLESLHPLDMNRSLQNCIPSLLGLSQAPHMLALRSKHLMVLVSRAMAFFNLAYLGSSEGTMQDNVIRHLHHRHLLLNPDDRLHGMQPKEKAIISSIGVICGVLLLACILALCRMKLHPWFRLRRHPRAHPPKLPSLKRFRRYESSKMFDLSLTFISMRDLVKATDGFNGSRVIGDGGFGLVYHATLADGRAVAVKKLATDGIQGKREFEAEIETLGHIKHQNLVELLAFCKFGEERALVYEFMENGSLDTWLHEKENGPELLDWKKRVRIAKEAAKGLAYLHHECVPHVIHRDIKSSNILLGKEFEARIADFGLARHISDSLSHVSTEAAGTLGYMAPEYYLTLSATKQADVYSFGMLLLELASGKRPNDTLEDRSLRTLAIWAHHAVAFKCEMDLLDPVIKGKPLHLDEVRAYISIACHCISECPENRPTMKEVYGKLSLLDVDTANGENVDKSVEL